MEVSRRRFRVTGIVQGVGFRPHVYAVAAAHGLAGFVRNDLSGVEIEVEGAPRAIEAFREALTQRLPDLAVVDSIDSEELPAKGDASFEIVVSRGEGGATAPVAPDAATCKDCLAELFDPADRRFRYPFINCTACGPRYTIVTEVPYDREHTTMAGFEMCSACRREYEDPSDRRFHAEPVACPDCGPRLVLTRGETTVTGDQALRAVTPLLQQGAIVAIKGLGGFHLACRASDQKAVTALRDRKAREQKPFAVMVSGLDAARALADLTEDECRHLLSRRAPIVLARRRTGADVADAVAPGNRFLGLMLPYTPVHHLLLRDTDGPLVMTSANLSDEPLVYRDEEARDKLGGIADAFVTHDRPIHTRCDDSVIRVFAGQAYPLRRSRGSAPEPLRLPRPVGEPVLGAGAELKSTFCLAEDHRAVLSPHIGDLESWEAFESYRSAIDHLQRLFAIAPAVVVHDLHPDYLSTRWALSLPDVRTLAVQHHHAHLASCLADNQVDGPAVGLVLDGTGAGDDGTIWGFEVLVGDASAYRRFAHLRPVPLPGASAAIKEPWRMAAAYLDLTGDGIGRSLPVRSRNAQRWDPVLDAARAGINSPLASSAGRLFDAVAALCDVRDRSSYEGQAAAELEQLADPGVTRSYPSCYRAGMFEGAELVAAVVSDLERGIPRAEVAAAFHNGLVASLVAAAREAATEAGLSVTALSGGAFQNLLLLERTKQALQDAGFEVLIHRRVPPNDAGIALGQVAIAAARA